MTDIENKAEVIPAGMICKSASISAQEVTEAELRAINKYTLEPLKSDDVFTFKVALCDNEVDRMHERFSLKALQGFQKLFVGKTVIKDHVRNTDNQVARIYATELSQASDKMTASGELYTQLMAKCYMVKTEKNADLIAEIKAGIKKEGSVGCSVSSVVCSVCGTDNAKTYCRHWAGKSYAVDGKETVCTFTLDGARDAYEFSLVAVPAQKKAGVSKSYTGQTVYESDEVFDEVNEVNAIKADDEPKDTALEDLLTLRMRLAKAKNHSNSVN